MPIEIKELVIKAEFGPSRDETMSASVTDKPDMEPEELIQECVRQVLEILNRKQER